MGVGLFSYVTNDRTRGSGQVLEWAAQGGGRVTVPGGVQEVFRFCTEEHGSVGNISVSTV